MAHATRTMWVSSTNSVATIDDHSNSSDHYFSTPVYIAGALILIIVIIFGSLICIRKKNNTRAKVHMLVDGLPKYHSDNLGGSSPEVYALPKVEVDLDAQTF